MIKFEIDNKNEKSTMQMQGDEVEILTDLLKMYTITVNEWLKACEKFGATDEDVNKLKYDTLNFMKEFIDNPFQTYNSVEIDL